MRFPLFIPTGTPVLPHSGLKKLQTDGIALAVLELMNDDSE